MQKGNNHSKSIGKKVETFLDSNTARKNNLIRLFSENRHRLPNHTNTNYLLNYHLNNRSPYERYDINNVTRKKPMFDLGGYFGGPQFKTKNTIGPININFDINFGRTEESISAGPSVTRGGELSANYKQTGVGIKIEQKGDGKPEPPDFDIFGRVIPGTGKTESDVLAYSPWKWQGRLFTKAFGNSKIEYSEEDFTLKFDEAFIFWGVKAEMNISEIMRRLKIYLRRHRMINDANYRNSTIRR